MAVDLKVNRMNQWLRKSCSLERLHQKRDVGELLVRPLRIYWSPQASSLCSCPLVFTLAQWVQVDHGRGYIQFKAKWLYKALMGSVNAMRSFVEPLGLNLLPPPTTPSEAIVLGHNPTASWRTKSPKHKAHSQEAASVTLALSAPQELWALIGGPLEHAASLLTGTKSILKLEICPSGGQTVI